MLNDIFEKILELEKEISKEETNLPTKKEHIVSEYRTKAQQEIAVLMRDNEHQHDENTQDALDKADQERIKIYANKDAEIEVVSEQYKKNHKHVLEKIISEVMDYGDR